MNKKRFSCFILLLCVVLVGIGLGQQPANSTDQVPAKANPAAVSPSTGVAQASPDTTPTNNDRVLLDKLLDDYPQHIDKIYHLLTILSIVVAAIMVFVMVYVIIFSIRQQNEINEKINSIKSEMEINFTRDIRERIQQTLMENLLDSFQQQIEFRIAFIDKRLFLVEYARISIWDQLVPLLIQAAIANNWGEYHRIWGKYFKMNLALSQIISTKPIDAWNGLASFISLFDRRINQTALWELVLLLKKQNRLRDPRVFNMAVKLGDALGRRLDEPMADEMIES